MGILTYARREKIEGYSYRVEYELSVGSYDGVEITRRVKEDGKKKTDAQPMRKENVPDDVLEHFSERLIAAVEQI